MKCPLIKKVVFQELPTINLVEGDCLREECAWWDDRFQQCLAVTATEQLFKLASNKEVDQ